MLRLLALLAIVALAGCNAAPQATLQSASVTAPDTTNLTRKLQNHWGQCLNQSYRSGLASTPDKNAAAEMAFAACASEEQDLASYSTMNVPPEFSPMPHLKSGNETCAR